MLNSPLLPGDPPLFRMAQAGLQVSLADTPVVLIQGPRQSGKTTLARTVAEPLGYGYVSFDDDNLARAARLDPLGFVSDLPYRMVLDEIQRVPEVFTALKLMVDRDRRPGRFLLTGSADVLLLPKLADSMAGLIDVVRLHPLAQVELRKASANFLTQLFEANFKPSSFKRMGTDLAEIIVAGGFPAALARPPERRRAWYQSYVQTLVQRDVRDLARISALDVMPRLLQLAAGQTAHLFNVSELAGPFGLSLPTVRDYLSLLERVFLIDLLPPWHRQTIKRLVKTPKLHLGDTGLAAILLRVDAARLYADRALLGQLLETFVFQELRRQASGRDEPIVFHHFRSRDDHEVDFVLEQADTLVGVQVKASGTVRTEDFRGLRKLREIAGDRFACGVVLYDGEASVRFGPNLFAMSVQALWAEPGQGENRGFVWPKDKIIEN